jgi:Ankyrin repeats (3 copies)
VRCREFTGSTPLLCACTGGHTAVAVELLQQGAVAVVDVPGRRGLTPLMAAVKHAAAVKALLGAGASVAVVNALTKDTALHEGDPPLLLHLHTLIYVLSQGFYLACKENVCLAVIAVCQIACVSTAVVILSDC